MKKSLLIIIIVGLGIIAGLSIMQRGSTLSRTGSVFRLRHPDLVTTIRLEGEKNDLILLKTENGWVHGSSLINADKVKSLLLLSSQLQVSAPVSISAEEEVEKQFERGVRAAFYADNKVLLSFDICEWDSKVYARKPGKKQVYQVQSKAYSSVPLIRYFTPQPEKWLSNILIDISPGELSSVAIEWLDKPHQSFILFRTSDNQLQVTDFDNTNLLAESDQESINDYTTFFQNIRFVNLTDTAEIQMNDTPFFNLKINTSRNFHLALTGYLVINDSTRAADPFLFAGFDQRDQLYLLNFSQFDPILVTRDYFLKK